MDAFAVTLTISGSAVTVAVPCTVMLASSVSASAKAAVSVIVSARTMAIIFFIFGIPPRSEPALRAIVCFCNSGACAAPA